MRQPQMPTSTSYSVSGYGGNDIKCPTGRWELRPASDAASVLKLLDLTLDNPTNITLGGSCSDNNWWRNRD
ncbi:glyoxal oxidase [Moniliophthora roreri]|nr:glyoxal oxidase [Moniliophthora roreri]